MSELSWKYVKELKNKEAIDIFEKENGVSFPTDLKDILLKYNGGRPSLRYFDTDTLSRNPSIRNNRISI